MRPCKSWQNRGIAQWIVSGNVESTIRKIIAHSHLPISTNHISGYKYDMTRDHYKRKVAIIGNALKRLPTDAEVIYIGDEATDVEACKHLGVQCLFATLGSREREAAQHLDVGTLNDPSEVLDPIACWRVTLINGKDLAMSD